MSLHVSGTSAHRQEAKIVLYIVSGIITPIGGRPVHSTKFYNEFNSCLYMFRAHVLIVSRPKLYYTVSGTITPIGVMIPETV